MRCVLYLLITVLFLLLRYHHVDAASVSTTRNATNTTTEMSRDMQQKLALFQFKLSSFSIHNSPSLNWSMSSDYCRWEGVRCVEMTGDVIGLYLSYIHLVGSIHPNSTLFQLSHLQVIDFRDIFVSGVIPEEIFHLPNLKVFYISPNYFSSNNLSVNLPKLRWGSSNTLKRLHLVGVNIIGGVLPDSIGYLNSLTYLYVSIPSLSGPIPKSIGNLTQLTQLDLSFNSQLSGPIPDTIGYLNSLISLELFDCNLSGPIPKSIGNLTQLTLLDLIENHLSGRIPDSLANLKKLEYLRLGGNNLKGEFPFWVANLTKLYNLLLSDNSLTGSLPSYLPPHSLLQLNDLDLSNNSLRGTIPSWLFQLPSLTDLDIGHNEFTGQLSYQFNSSASSLLGFTCSNNLLNGIIPKSFSDQLVSLMTLDFSSNKFSGDLDLESFSHLQNLRDLYLSDNSLSLRITSTTTLPPALQFLGLASCKITKFPRFIASLENLVYLDLSNNQIDGNIPDWIGGLTDLNLSHNSLTGGLEQLPWSSLEYLDLQSNMLNGSLSSSICNSTSLDILNLSHNNFSGVFPVCPGNLIYRLSVLDLRINNITGSLPLALSKFQYLRTLNMHGNKLQGTIPVSFSKFDFLEVLDLGSNHINDIFPHCLEVLPKLQVFILKSNKFNGIINNISQTEHPFPSLRIIDLSDNQFSGPLPAKFIDNFKGMMNKEVNKVPLGYMGEFYYSDSIALVIKGRDMELVNILTIFTTIDLSRNMFEGEIPAHIGNLVSLRYLNLSHNHLAGSIPSTIGDLSMLESLDFSSNQLVGEIPQQLTHIDSLAKLNLSHNDLNGRIPEAPHFTTFDDNSYSGNPELCGFPLSKKCREDNIEPHEEEEEDDYFLNGFSWEAVAIGYGCGVVLGFVAGYIMFMAGKPK